MSQVNGTSTSGHASYGQNVQYDLTAQEIERFWSKVKRQAKELCWLWQGSVTGSGSVKHGQFTVTRHGRNGKRQRMIKAHRVAWVATHGSIPSGLCVCHRCDVPRCCNPSHLFLGTQQDNLIDARRKGRLDESRPRWPLSWDAYREIILTNQRGVDLVRKFGVTKTTISRIRNGHQGRRIVERILQDQAGQPEARLTDLDVSHQLEQPLSLGKVR